MSPCTCGSGATSRKRLAWPCSFCWLLVTSKLCAGVAAVKAGADIQRVTIDDQAQLQLNPTEQHRASYVRREARADAAQVATEAVRIAHGSVNSSTIPWNRMSPPWVASMSPPPVHGLRPLPVHATTVEESRQEAQKFQRLVVQAEKQAGIPLPVHATTAQESVQEAHKFEKFAVQAQNESNVTSPPSTLSTQADAIDFGWPMFIVIISIVLVISGAGLCWSAFSSSKKTPRRESRRSTSRASASRASAQGFEQQVDDH
mmetsp:Transcript_117197/g.250437  ORF Transcript_117197/g.250437 Transcript_117197/m.250437 type:complete len:259 (+) Transcript_117197:43-819(+)